MNLETFNKGAYRYLKLKENLCSYLNPQKVEAFFVAVHGRGGKLRMANPFAIFQREFVVAVTDQYVVVLRLKLPGVFSTTITKTEVHVARSDATVKQKGGRLILNDESLYPVAFHERDAQEVFRLLSGPL